MTTMKRLAKSTLLKALGGQKGIGKLNVHARLYAQAGIARELGNHALAEALVKKAIDNHSKKSPAEQQASQ